MPVICKKDVKRKLPPEKAAVEVLSASAGGRASLRQAPGGRKNLIVGPSCSQMRKGGCIMVLNDVLQLLVVIGGTVGITFKISWAIFQEIHNNKK